LSKYKAYGENKFRIIILDESHLLSNQSQNAFLKLLESKNNNLILMLATTEYNKIIPQLASRCMELYIKIPSQSEVVSRLSNILKQENVDFNIDALELIAENSKCHIRNAVNIAEQIILYDDNINIDVVSKFLNLDIYADYYYLLINIIEDINKSVDILEKCSIRESIKNIHYNIFNILIKTYQKFLGYNVRYNFQNEKNLINTLIDIYKEDLIKLLELFNISNIYNKSDLLFYLFKIKNRIEFKIDLENNITIDQDVLSSYKEKEWFKNKQGNMWLKSNNRLKKTNNLKKPNIVNNNNKSITEDIIPLTSHEFLDYIKENMRS